MGDIPNEVEELLKQRETLRKEKKYQKADEVRQQIEKNGYLLIDTPQGPKLEKKMEIIPPTKKTPNDTLIALFGSGEMSPSGRRVHGYLIQDLIPPVEIALLETPAGFEANPHHWYQRLAEAMMTGLQNSKPKITLVPALHKDGEQSTNNPKILAPLLSADYIHAGAGSPTYAVRHLRDSLAYDYMMKKIKEKTPTSFASAVAIAFSRFALPVYEIYKVGLDLYWEKGMDFFSQWNLNLTVVPHWNNAEGGADIDTRFCYMGEQRFQKLLKLLPGPTTILGIDEQTACVFNMEKQEVLVMGTGTATIMKGKSKRVFKANETFPFSLL